MNASTLRSRMQKVERVDPALVHFTRRLGIPSAYQVVREGDRDYVEEGVRVVPAARFLTALV